MGDDKSPKKPVGEGLVKRIGYLRGDEPPSRGLLRAAVILGCGLLAGVGAVLGIPRTAEKFERGFFGPPPVAVAGTNPSATGSLPRPVPAKIDSVGAASRDTLPVPIASVVSKKRPAPSSSGLAGPPGSVQRAPSPDVPALLSIGKEVAGGFFGAMFAFVFLRLNDVFTGRYSRQRRHFNALSRLQHLLNDWLGILSDNVYVTEKFCRSVRQGNVHYSFGRQIPIDKSIYQDLINLDLINAVRSLFDMARKLNDDSENTATNYADFRHLYLTDVWAREKYIANVTELTKVFDIGIRAHEEFVPEVRRVLAWTRILCLRDHPQAAKLAFAPPSSAVVTEEEIAAENASLDNEIEESGKESRKRIDRILGEAKPEAESPK